MNSMQTFRTLAITVVAGLFAALLPVSAGAASLPVANEWGGAGPGDGQFAGLMDVAVSPARGDGYTIEDGGASNSRMQPWHQTARNPQHLSAPRVRLARG